MQNLHRRIDSDTIDHDRPGRLKVDFDGSTTKRLSFHVFFVCFERYAAINHLPFLPARPRLQLVFEQ
ncbi:hypothetical protein D9757_013170 [Collybiopsis confluens]|uniref:Uncharacterized protein n=1 Tax=Collybiopsis confluens TaxID=2823264 RepID=A0A8H5D6J8_9AGAR|nr:hypothetical protein D9757_013170 [Collybiopsis confluens]